LRFLVKPVLIMNVKANLMEEIAKGFVTTVQLRSVEEVSGKAKVSGNPYKFRVLSCEFAGTGKQLELTQWPDMGSDVLPPVPCERGKNFTCSVSKLEVVKGFMRGAIDKVFEA